VILLQEFFPNDNRSTTVHRLHSITVSVVISTAVLFSAACASSGGRQQQYSRAPYTSDLLTWSELAAETHRDAYAAVEQLRPLFLSPRPGAADARGQPRTIRVFIDGDFAGDQEILRSIPAREIESVRRLQPAMAYATMGSLHMGDEVLMVRLRCHASLC
jgi:hypothetical protein